MTEQEYGYEWILSRIWTLMSYEDIYPLSEDELTELIILSNLVEAYESLNYPMN